MLATLISSPKLISFNPVVYSTGGQLYLSLPIGNTGTLSAPSVFVSAITLGSAQRASPVVLPVYLGTIEIGNRAALNTRFKTATLVVGQQYLLTVRGTYQLGTSQYGFTVSRYIVLPAPVAAPVALLAAQVDVQLESAVWNYRVSNNEPAGSALYVASFSLDVANAVTVTGTPPGWAVLTDNMTSVLWYSLDSTLPYATHIAPGASLSGFQIQCATPRSESTPYAVNSWDHESDAAGLVSFDYALSPGRPS